MTSMIETSALDYQPPGPFEPATTLTEAIENFIRHVTLEARRGPTSWRFAVFAKELKTWRTIVVEMGEQGGLHDGQAMFGVNRLARAVDADAAAQTGWSREHGAWVVVERRGHDALVQHVLGRGDRNEVTAYEDDFLIVPGGSREEGAGATEDDDPRRWDSDETTLMCPPSELRRICND